MYVTTNVSVACPLTGAAGGAPFTFPSLAGVVLPVAAVSGMGPFRLYHRYVVGNALDASPFTTTLNVTLVPTNTFTSPGCCVITGASTKRTVAGSDDTDPLPRAVTDTV